MKIPLFKVFMSPESSVLVGKTLQSGYIGQGPRVEEFEKELADILRTDLINTVNSATSAIHLALHSKKLSHHPERNVVLTTPITCVATNMPICQNGLCIRWVDMNPNTCNMDLDDLRSKLRPEVLAIMVVHWAGYPVDLAMLNMILDEFQIKYGYRPAVIEDCAHAFGSKFQGRMLGTGFGTTAVYSFQAIKHLTTGDGGLICSPSDSDHRRLKKLRWYGYDRQENRFDQDIPEMGFKFHMNDVAASIGLANLPHVAKNIQRHRKNAKYLRDALSTVKDIKLLEDKDDRDSSCWVLTLMVERRDKFMAMMRDKGIEVSPIHSRNDKMQCFRRKASKVELPLVSWISKQMCCVPCGWWMNKTHCDYLIDCVRGGW